MLTSTTIIFLSIHIYFFTVLLARIQDNNTLLPPVFAFYHSFWCWISIMQLRLNDYSAQVSILTTVTRETWTALRLFIMNLRKDILNRTAHRDRYWMSILAAAHIRPVKVATNEPASLGHKRAILHCHTQQPSITDAPAVSSGNATSNVGQSHEKTSYYKAEMSESTH